MDFRYLQYQLPYHGIQEMRIRCRKNYQVTQLDFFELNLKNESILHVLDYRQQKPEQLSACPGLFCVLNYPEELPLPELDGFYLKSGYAFAEVLHSLYAIFQDYDKWKFALIYSESMDLNTILELSLPVLHMPLCIVDTEFSFIAKNSLYDEMFPEAKVDEKETDALLWDSRFQKCAAKTGVFHYDLLTAEKTLLCYNLTLGSRFYARLLGNLDRSENAKVQEQLFAELASCMAFLFQEQRTAALSNWRNQEFMQVVGQLICGKRPADDRVLRREGWSFADEYQVVVVRSSGFFPMESAGKYLLRELNQSLPDCCVLEHHQDYVCVRNLSSTIEKLGDFRERLSIFLREHLARAGISNTFSGMENFSVYLTQAYDALRIGEGKNPHFWHYSFQDCAFDYLLEQCVSGYSVSNVIAGEIRKLKKMDEEKGTELSETLKTYLVAGCNASASAELLHIHRSSLMKRLERISAVTGVNLEDPDARLYLALSYKLLEQRNNR